jgi:formylglycine-generating enzyme required for sulfatase activity
MTRILVMTFVSLGLVGISCGETRSGPHDTGPDADAAETGADADQLASDADRDDDACVPGCEGHTCGPDGCGGECAPGCERGQACDGSGRCAIPDRDWITVRAGTYIVGSPEAEVGRYDAEVAHEVTLTRAFSIQATEVTQLELEAVLGTNPSSFIECGPACPVESITWHQAAAYCNELSDIEGLDECYECLGIGGAMRCDLDPEYPSPYDCTGYRLPTEAEWEVAARAETTTATYGGDLTADRLACEQPNPVLDPIARFCGNSGGPWDGTPAPMHALAPNPWGLFDVLGNVWEWCHDWHAEYPPGSSVDPWGPSSGANRVTRGGAWNTDARQVRAAHRAGIDPLEATNAVGFRPARTLH